MPIYEYVSKEDGEVLELLRPMSQADSPVSDPAGRGRTFLRRQSAFSAGGKGGAGGDRAGTADSKVTGLPVSGGCCPCGKNAGACSRPK